ncbi:MAG: DoxX family protein [Bacillus sp. (in: firmicutes)]
MINKYEAGTFVLRIVLGISFFIHGLAKFQAGITNTAGWFESIGLPGFLAYLVAGGELVGGIALIIGLLSRIVSLLLAVIMISAIVTVKLSAGFLNGFELEVAYFVMAVSIAITGSRAFAIDALLFKEKEETSSFDV